MITEQLAELYLPSNRIERFRLALATKPHDVPFLCHVPSRNLDNSWNDTNSKACCEAKTNWTLVTSRKPEGIEFTRSPTLGMVIKPSRNPTGRRSHSKT